jgi:hypothetical protein
MVGDTHYEGCIQPVLSERCVQVQATDHPLVVSRLNMRVGLVCKAVELFESSRLLPYGRVLLAKIGTFFALALCIVFAKASRERRQRAANAGISLKSVMAEA